MFARPSPITFTLPSSKAYQKSGSFPPPALPGFNRHITLSNSPSATGSIDTLRVDSSSTNDSRPRGALPVPDMPASQNSSTVGARP